MGSIKCFCSGTKRTNRVERRLGDRVEATKLASRLGEEACVVEVDDTEESKSEEEPRRNAGDDHKCGEDAETTDEGAADMVGEAAKEEGVSFGDRTRSIQSIGSRCVDVLKVLSEAVEEPAECLSVEEAQRGAKDGVEDHAVEALTGAKRSHVEDEPASGVSRR